MLHVCYHDLRWPPSHGIMSKEYVRNPNSIAKKVLDSHGPNHQQEKSKMLGVDHRVASCLFLVELKECCEKSYSCNLTKDK